MIVAWIIKKEQLVVVGSHLRGARDGAWIKPHWLSLLVRREQSQLGSLEELGMHISCKLFLLVDDEKSSM
jgi:hypothetical protein